MGGRSHVCEASRCTTALYRLLPPVTALLVGAAVARLQGLLAKGGGV